MAIDILSEQEAETKPVLSARELPVTFTLQVKRKSPYRYEGTISNTFPFEAQMCRVGMHHTSEIPHTLDRCTYEFLLRMDNYILIECQGKQYILDAQVAEEEVR